MDVDSRDDIAAIGFASRFPEAPNALSPLVDRCVTRGPGYAVFEKVFEHDEDPVVGHHGVLGRFILPAVGYWEMVVVAAQQTLGNAPARLHDVAILAPLVVDPGQRVRCLIEVRVDPTAPVETCDVRVFTTADPTAANDDDRYVVHLTARADRGTAAPEGDPAPFPIDAVRGRCPNEYPAGATYQAAYAAESGITYGRFFQTLGRIQCGAQELLAEVQVTAEPGRRPGAPAYRLHPGLLDGALQSWAGFRMGLATASDESFIPMFIREVQLLAPLPDRVVAHAELATRLDSSDEAIVDVIKGDTTLYDPQGRPVVRVLGFVMKRVAGRRLAAAGAPHGDALLAWEWQPSPLEAREPDSGATASGLWLVLADNAGLAAATVAALRARSAEVVEIAAGTRYARLGSHRFRVALDLASDFDQMAAALGPARPIAGIVHALAFAPREDALEAPEALADTMPVHVSSAIALLRCLHAHGWLSAPVPTWFAISHGWQAAAGDGTPAPERALLWSAARSLTQDLPAVQARVVDFGDTPAAEAAPRLIAELGNRAPEDTIAWRGDVRLVRRLAQLAVPGASAAAAFRFEAGGRYVVTGGGGGIGRRLAKWLVEKHGCSVALIGRSPRAREPLASGDGGDAGGRALYFSADVADWARLRDVAEEARRALGGIDGVIHAAGVPGELGNLLDQPAAAIEAVLAPKVAGTRNLIEAFRDARFFVFFSSVSAHAPGLARGLAPYAIANAFLDGAAGYLRSRDIPAVSIAWGPWRGDGMLAQDSAPEMERRGFRLIDFGAGIALLEQAMASGRDAVIAAPHDPVRCNLTAPAPAGEPKGVEIGEDGSYADLLARQVAAALKVPMSRIDRRKKFMELGLDSLALLGFAKALEQSLKMKLYPSVYFEYPTIEKLADYIAALHAAHAASPAVEAPAPPRRAIAAGARVRLEFYMDRMIAMRWRVRGALDRAVLEKALQFVVDRHDLLRVEAEVQGAEIELRPARALAPYRLEYEDLAMLSPDERSAVVGACLQKELVRAERLSIWPLLRFKVFREDDRNHLAVVSIPHAICDGYSIVGVLQRDIAEAYRAFSAGQAPALPAPESTYWQWVEMLEAQRRSEEYRLAQAHWAAVLAPPLPPQELPTDFARDPGRSTEVDVMRAKCDSATVQRIVAQASQAGVTVYVLLLSLWLRRLYLWSGEADRVIMVPVSARQGNLPDLEQIVGCMVHALPLRVRVEAGEAFEALVERVAAASRSTMRHAAMPFDRPRPAAAAFTFPHFIEAERPKKGALLDWELEDLRNEIGHDDVDVLFLGTIVGSPNGPELLLNWTWQRALFRAETMGDLAQSFVADIDDLVKGRSLPLSLATPGGETAGADDDLDRLVREVEELSDEEVEAELGRLQASDPNE